MINKHNASKSNRVNFEPAAGIAAVEVALHDVFDDRPEIPILPLETALIFCQEPVEVMK